MSYDMIQDVMAELLRCAQASSEQGNLYDSDIEVWTLEVDRKTQKTHVLAVKVFVAPAAA